MYKKFLAIYNSNDNIDFLFIRPLSDDGKLAEGSPLELTIWNRIEKMSLYKVFQLTQVEMISLS